MAAGRESELLSLTLRKAGRLKIHVFEFPFQTRFKYPSLSGLGLSERLFSFSSSGVGYSHLLLALEFTGATLVEVNNLGGGTRAELAMLRSHI